jgi:hypothetical protein
MEAGDLDLLTWFAGQALIGLLSGEPSLPASSPDHIPEQIARRAFEIAEAMVAERDRRVARR